MIFNEKDIKDSFKNSLLSKNIFFLEGVDSTNNFARYLIQNGKGEGNVVISDYQTKGRGRLGRKWHSPPGMGVWMTVILRLTYDNVSIHFFNYLCILSVVEAIHDLISVKSEIKWPNDILVGKKKVCGVLSEVVKSNNNKEFVTAGIGLNVNQNYNDFPPELSEIATSLRIVYGSELVREKVIIKILQFLEKNYKLYIEGNIDYIFNEWLKWCTTIGKKIRVVTAEKYFEGIAVDIKPDGKLILKNELNEIKEVTPVDIIQIIEYTD
ncbi:biotin--[acetyl-CoA-carboxylase] ligase [candidate division KSB1 bacterium]